MKEIYVIYQITKTRPEFYKKAGTDFLCLPALETTSPRLCSRWNMNITKYLSIYMKLRKYTHVLWASYWCGR